MRKGPNPKVFLMLAVAAFVLGGGLCFMAFKGLESTQDNFRMLQADSKDAKALQRQLADSQASLQESTSKLQHLEEGVQDYAYVPTLLSDLDKLGKASGIDVTGVRPVAKPASPKKDGSSDTESVAKKSYDALDIEVKGRGKYRAVMNFIEALGKFPKIVAARTVELAPKNEPGQAGTTLDVTISLRAYVFPVDREPNKKTAMASGSTHEG
ncbi:MAG: type 4a pilus biogenesis protein PilO [Fimbriimonadales bacterium]